MRRLPGLLEVLALGAGVDPRMIGWLAARIEDRLGVRTVLGPALPLQDSWRAPGGACFDSNRVVDALVDRLDTSGAAPDERWTLALTEVDLCAPGRPFVFGEATLGGCCAVVSLARLRPSAETLDPARLRERAFKEALHEIGHIAGLGHCADPACVMAEAPDVSAVDRRGADFCAACAAAEPGPGRP
jgi:archaemetzincin